MNISFLSAELHKWDLLERAPDALMLPFFADERPLRGAAGLCDFRLCGRLSRLLAREKLAGDFGETTLYPPGARLPFPRLVLFGLGDQAKLDDARAAEAARKLRQIAERMRFTRYAIAPPGRSTGRLSARRALEVFLAEAGQGAQEIVIVESPAGQKEAAEIVRK